MPVDEPSSDSGKLVANLIHFARALRAAGLPIGPGKVLDAVRAVEAVGLDRRDDFYWTLHAVFVNRRDQRELFDQTFHVFWRNPQILERMMALVLPETQVGDQQEQGRELSRRVAEALQQERDDTAEEPERETRIEFDGTLTYSAEEQLREKDFEDMSSAEIDEARRAMARMRLPVRDLPTRRFAADPRGARISMRRTLRQSLRSGGHGITLIRKSPRRRPPAIVVLCDISGSMSRYSRMFLHFMHAVTNHRDRVHTFLFGTRLTNITRQLRARDVDEALAKVAESVDDWDGGTRIGTSLHEFNRDWSRRVLGQGAMVILISDGLDRDAGAGLEGEMERLHKSCRRLIWLNPLLRFEDFEPRAAGIRAILPHVDEFRPAHNLNSFALLVDALTRPAPRRAEGVSTWKHQLN